MGALRADVLSALRPSTQLAAAVEERRGRVNAMLQPHGLALQPGQYVSMHLRNEDDWWGRMGALRAGREGGRDGRQPMAGQGGQTRCLCVRVHARACTRVPWVSLRSVLSSAYACTTCHPRRSRAHPTHTTHAADPLAARRF